jgi:signal transduction histidine kinase
MKGGYFILIILVFRITHVFSQDLPRNISPEVSRVIEEATSYMGESAYDSAGMILNRAFSQTDVSFSQTDLYYLLVYEAENMYYNALFDEGLNSAYRSLELAKSLQNDTLIANAENIVGLLLMSMDKYEDALSHFRRSTALTKPHELDYLSYGYQVLSNAAECFLKLNQPDSAFYYVRRGYQEAVQLKKLRGQSIIHWTLAEALLQKNEFDSARAEVNQGLQLVAKSQHRDIVLTFYTTNMRIAQVEGDKEETFEWMNRGLEELKNPLNTDYARVDFLETAADVCISMKVLEKGSELMRSWKQLQKNLIEKQQSQRLTILKDYYETNQRLVLAKEHDTAQRRQIELRNMIAAILGVLSVLLVILIGIVWVYYRQRQRISRLEYKEQLRRNEIEFELRLLENRMAAVSAERDRIASDLHDDIGASLSSIRIYSGAASKRFTSDPDESLRLIERINESSSGMMDRMSDIVWAINPKNDNVESIVFRMKSNAGEVLSPLDIEVDYSIDSLSEQVQPTMTARRNIYLIFKEAINNIAKYSRAKHVHVDMRVENGFLILDISDDGVGFDALSKPSGNGLNTMRRRAESLGGTVQIDSKPGNGSRMSARMEIARISDGKR